MAAPPPNQIFVVNIPPCPVWDPNTSKFTHWFIDFEAHCAQFQLPPEPVNAAGVILPAVNRRRFVFTSSVGVRAKEMLITHFAPRLPNQVTIPEMYDVLVAKFDPPGMVETNRILLRQRVQGANETAGDFADALQALASVCGWSNNQQARNENLKTQFIVGLRNKEIKLRLLPPEVTYDQARQLAVQNEALQQHLKVITDQQQSIHAVSSRAGHSTLSASATPYAPTRGRGKGRARGRGGNQHHASTAPGRGSGQPQSSSEGSVKHHSGQQFAPCHRCGRRHDPRTCPAVEWTCYKCNRKGHIAPKCFTKVLSVQQEDVDTVDVDLSSMVDASAPYLSLSEVNNVNVIFVNVDQVAPSTSLTVDITLGTQVLQAEIDTGAGVSLMSHELFSSHFASISLSPCHLSLVSASGPLLVLGQVAISVSIHNIKPKILTLIICKTEKVKFLCGRPWLDVFFPEWRLFFLDPKFLVHNVAPVPVLDCVSAFKTKYPAVFDLSDDSPIKHYTAKLILKDNVTPIRHPPYPIPYAFKDIADDKIDSLVKSKKIEKVAFSEHASPFIILPKKTGQYRMCVDFKKTLNQQINVEYYPLPNIHDIFASLSNGKCFTVLDLSDAYMQLELHPDSRPYVTINTHRGLFRYNRLVYGLSSAPAIFQQVMDEILREIPDVFCYLDDILIKGQTLQECVNTTDKVLARLNEFNVKVQFPKCVWFVNSVLYLGYQVSGDGRKPNPSKVTQVLEMATPSSASQVSKFLGMLSHYASFLPNLSTLVKPLRDLTLTGVPFEWDESCEQAFVSAKELLSSDSLLMHYDPALPIVVTADASPVGLGATLSHSIQIDGKEVERPVLFASCTLTPVQQRYSQLDREAFALVFAVTKFRKHLLGRAFTLCTDNDPIRHILNPKKGIPIHASIRLQHWSLILQSYQFVLRHRKSVFMSPADTLSRLPLGAHMEDPVTIASVLPDKSLPLNVSVIAAATALDSLLSRVLDQCLRGWPIKKPSDPGLVLFYQFKNLLTVDRKCLMYGNRVLIPESLRMEVLSLLHAGHPGVVRMKALSRMYVWWPSMTLDIEEFCKNCNSCTIVNFTQKHVYVPWPQTKAPFERVHIDFYEFQLVKFFIFVDSYSKWVHVVRMSTTTAKDVITVLLSIFAMVGYPLKLVADNGPPFQSDELNDFLTSKDITLLHSPPYHPESNGQAERIVQAAKKALKKMILDLDPTSDVTKVSSSMFQMVLDQYVSAFLCTYRNTPTTTMLRTPNQLLLAFQPRTDLSLLNPKNEGVASTVLFKPGDIVEVKFKKQPPFRATVVKHLGDTRYVVSASGILKTNIHSNCMSHALAPGI